MCCFSKAVELVANTRIFARFTAAATQFIAYQMTYQAKEPLAMILPIPTRVNAKEDALKFYNLEEYAEFFDDLKTGFPEPPVKAAFAGGNFGLGGGGGALAVADVGSFVASFVPKIADFARLDERFRLPDGTWEKIPAYRDYGFAVFQLKPDAQTVHPMAFEFPTRPQAGVFFPTVHIHDGKMHGQADFDHDLYLQPRDAMQRPPRGWTESDGPAEEFMRIDACHGRIDGELHCYRKKIKGERKNQDTWIV